MPVIFSVNVPNEMRVSQSSYVCSHIITPSTPEAFGEIFSKFSDGWSTLSWLESAHLTADPDELLTVFNSVCSEVLDSVAPYKIKHCKVNHQPWFNEHT